MLIRRTSNTVTDNIIVNSSYDYYNGGANNGRIQKITDNTDAAVHHDVWLRRLQSTKSVF